MFCHGVTCLSRRGWIATSRRILSPPSGGGPDRNEEEFRPLGNLVEYSSGVISRENWNSLCCRCSNIWSSVKVWGNVPIDHSQPFGLDICGPKHSVDAAAVRDPSNLKCWRIVVYWWSLRAIWLWVIRIIVVLVVLLCLLFVDTIFWALGRSQNGKSISDTILGIGIRCYVQGWWQRWQYTRRKTRSSMPTRTSATSSIAISTGAIATRAIESGIARRDGSWIHDAVVWFARY